MLCQKQTNCLYIIILCLANEHFQRKIVNNFLTIILAYVLGAQKNLH